MTDSGITLHLQYPETRRISPDKGLLRLFYFLTRKGVLCMKKWMKTAAAAFIGAAICTAAGSLSASADVTPDGDTLKLSGNVTVDEVQAYANNEAVKKVVCEPGTVFPEDSSYLFYQFMYAESIDLSNADTSQVTDMENLFAWCHELTSLKISNFKTNNVTNMSGMFALCYKLKKLRRQKMKL